MLKPSDQIGPYKLVTKLGNGAFGVVWLAERRTAITTTKVALKLPSTGDIDLDAIKREADLWVQASGHPNVLPIIEANIYGEHLVIASEYAPDGPLELWLQQHGGKAPSVRAAVDMTCGILAGLEHLHEQSIIHRDLKPANILLQRGIPRLADFGVSRVLKTTSHKSLVAGTPAYMAPETFDGKRSQQTDLWSVGVILYQLLSGKLPFPYTDMASLLSGIITREPEPLPFAVPAQLQTAVARALQKRPSERYGSAAEMRGVLLNATQRLDLAETIRDLEQPVTTERSNIPTVGRPARRPGLFLMSVLVFGVLVSVIVLLGMRSRAISVQPNASAIASPIPSVGPSATPVVSHEGVEPSPSPSPSPPTKSQDNRSSQRQAKRSQMKPSQVGGALKRAQRILRKPF